MMDAAAPGRVVMVRDFCAGLLLIFNFGQNHFIYFHFIFPKERDRYRENGARFPACYRDPRKSGGTIHGIVPFHRELLDLLSGEYFISNAPALICRRRIWRSQTLW